MDNKELMAFLGTLRINGVKRYQSPELTIEFDGSPLRIEAKDEDEKQVKGEDAATVASKIAR